MMDTKSNLTNIVLDHGTGGLLSQELVASFITPILRETYLGKMEDSAIVKLDATTIAMTTDSFVIDPIFFGNGNIGKVSVCGTVNDLAVSGAKPLYITLAMVIEEGFPLEDLRKIVVAIAETAKEAGVFIVAGDTKVVRKGEVDKIFINTSGVGVFSDEAPKLTMSSINDGDDIVVTSQLGNHSIHILSMREGLGYESRVVSDCAPLNNMINKVVTKFGTKIHYMRDLTRGGLGSALNEISEAIHKGIEVKLHDIPVQHETRMAADMLGVNPMYLANEGNLVIFCDPSISQELVNVLQNEKYGKNAKVVGKTTESKENKVIGIDDQGNATTIEHLYGQELPRLC